MSVPAILNKLGSRGHAVFTRGDYNLNIIGVRTPSRLANTFDDWMHVVFKQDDEWKDLKFPITTDPGLYWLEHPMRVEGTAILCPGQYRGVYKLGKHRGKYLALVQTGGRVKVWRDNNKDEVLDHDPEAVAQGYFGINIHRSSTAKGGSRQVEKYSAGCQVFQNPHDFDVFMSLCQRSAEKYGSTFTYTLVDW